MLDTGGVGFFVNLQAPETILMLLGVMYITNIVAR